MRMRSIARATPLLALLALTVSSAACGTASSSGTSSGPVSLSMWVMGDEGDKLPTSSVLTCQGPEMNIGVAPVAKVWVTSNPCGSLLGVSPCWKYLTHSVRELTEARLSSVNCPFFMTSPPAE